MAVKIKIALRYSYDENWIGGTYYIQNLIMALNTINDKKKPHLIILCDSVSDFDHLIQLTQYPYIERKSLLKPRNVFTKIINRISRTLFKIDFIDVEYSSFDFLFPGAFEWLKYKRIKQLFWIADFQEYYYGNFFSPEYLQYRVDFQKNIIKHANYIIFSSESVKKDFNKIYPQNKLKQFVLRFAVTHPVAFNHIRIDTLLKKYSLPKQYYVCCNQFWIHKNHSIVLKSLALLKKQGVNVFIAFSGKEYDYRWPGHTEHLKQEVIDLGLVNNISFLGFIDRAEQLVLIKNAQALIQPSLFEGWNTAIEDAKALNVKIIASNIDVHKEQLHYYTQKVFFNPLNEAELSTCISSVSFMKIEEFNYENLIHEYANTFINIIEEIGSDLTAFK